MCTLIDKFESHEDDGLQRNDDFSVFTLQVRPTFDFQQELLWNGEALEVLEPIWLRKEMATKVKQMWNHYKK